MLSLNIPPLPTPQRTPMTSTGDIDPMAIAGAILSLALLIVAIITLYYVRKHCLQRPTENMAQAEPSRSPGPHQEPDRAIPLALAGIKANVSRFESQVQNVDNSDDLCQTILQIKAMMAGCVFILSLNYTTLLITPTSGVSPWRARKLRKKSSQ